MEPPAARLAVFFGGRNAGCPELQCASEASSFMSGNVVEIDGGHTVW